MTARVVLSHPQRQHSHEAALALQEGNMLQRYLTAIWFDSAAPSFRLAGQFGGWTVGEHFRRIAAKRMDTRIDKRLVEQRPWEEVAARLLRVAGLQDPEETTFRLDRGFDRWSASRIDRLRPDIFIGYEMSALSSFRVCRRNGAVCVLDAAAEHWRFQRSVFEEEHRRGTPIWRGSYRILKRIEGIKSKELDLADVVIVPSSYALRTFMDAGVPASKLRLVPYGVDLSRFCDDPVTCEPERFTVMYVGSLIPRKGLHYLVRAWKELRLPRADLLVVGNGDLGFLGEDAAAVKQVAWLPHESLAEVYRRAHVFVLPSLMDSFGMVVLEAMASGTPVIVSENTGAKDVVREGLDGFVVPIRDVEALSVRIHALYCDRERAREMGRNARARAAEYSWTRYRARIRSLVNELLVAERRRGVESTVAR